MAGWRMSATVAELTWRFNGHEGAFIDHLDTRDATVGMGADESLHRLDRDNGPFLVALRSQREDLIERKVSPGTARCRPGPAESTCRCGGRAHPRLDCCARRTTLDSPGAASTHRSTTWRKTARVAGSVRADCDQGHEKPIQAVLNPHSRINGAASKQLLLVCPQIRKARTAVQISPYRYSRFRES